MLELEAQGDGELAQLVDGLREPGGDEVGAGSTEASGGALGVFAGPEGDEDLQVGEAVLEALAEVAGGGMAEMQTTLQACLAICSRVSAARSGNGMTRGLSSEAGSD
ncbi:MAG: hypothetical protein EPO20_07115 [Betaproteobacteria bacterium]|nr:MAG: hypothetical protein EPO20_07115 [Betaproteobacteria bacterium]